MSRAVDGRVHAEDAQLAARGLRHAADHPHRRRLPRAVGSEEAERFTGLDPEVDAVDRDEVAEAFADLRPLDQGFGARERHERRRYRLEFTSRADFLHRAPVRALAETHDLVDRVEVCTRRCLHDVGGNATTSCLQAIDLELDDDVAERVTTLGHR